MWHHSSVNGNIYFWLCLSCAFLDCHVAFESQVRAACCCLSNKSLLKQQIIQFFLFHPRPPSPSCHDKQPMVITRSLPVSEGDYFLPAENQMTNDHAERPQQQCVSRKADEGGVERRGYGRRGGLVFTCPRWPFPTRVCDSQSTSAWMRSRAPVPRRSNLTAARRAESGDERGWWVCAWAPDCGWGSPMSAMLFLGPISHWQHHVFFTYLFSW